MAKGGWRIWQAISKRNEDGVAKNRKRDTKKKKIAAAKRHGMWQYRKAYVKWQQTAKNGESESESGSNISSMQRSRKSA